MAMPVNMDTVLPTHIRHRRANTLPLEFDPDPYRTQAIPPRPEHIRGPWVERWLNYTKENAAVIGLVLALIGLIVAVIK